MSENNCKKAATSCGSAVKRLVMWRAMRRRRRLFLLACDVLRDIRYSEIELASEDRHGNKARIGIKLIDVHLAT